MKKNKVVWVQASDHPGDSDRWMSVQIVRQGVKRKSEIYVVRGASRRRMLRVLEAM